MDILRKSLRRGRCRYLAPFDIAGAFDDISHRKLMEGLASKNVGVHVRRVVLNWLASRTFQVKMNSPKGVLHSGVYPITKGMPQGGILSPLLWLVFCVLAPDRLRRRREANPQEAVEY